MKQWRCVNDPFSYCSNEPDFGGKAIPSMASRIDPHTLIYEPHARLCVNNATTCSYHISFSDLCKHLPPSNGTNTYKRHRKAVRTTE